MAPDITPANTEDYDVAICASGELTNHGSQACVALLRSGGAVNTEIAEREIRRATCVAVVRKNGQIVGVGAIKRIRRQYAHTIAQRSGQTFDPNTLELGYVAVAAKHRGNHLSSRIVKALLSEYNGPLFATTDNDRMKATLQKAGFNQKGRDWEGGRNLLSLWTKD